MNFYISLINETIDYIEANINKKLTLEDISNTFCVSEFHFNRIFKTVAGKTLKQYILGRKLTRALNRLSTTEEALINIAYDYGFEYPEVFSRAFKRQFGISPSTYRKEKKCVTIVEKLTIVERDIINYKGTLTLNGIWDLCNEIFLEGMSVEVNENSEEFRPLLESTGEAFLRESQKATWLNQERFYTSVTCHGEDNGEYTVFYGKETKKNKHKSKLQSYSVPAGWYVKFLYNGDMFDIREAFIDDLYRWIMLQEIELNSKGIGMLNIYEKDYLDTGNVQILVPIKNPE